MTEPMNPWGFYPLEWRQLSTTEKKIILLVRKHGLNDHAEIRKWINFPLEEEFNEKTYKSAFSRLKKKVQRFTMDRTKSTMNV